MPWHHIIPKHEWKRRFGTLDGVNSSDNMVNLTTEQHAQTHQRMAEDGSKWDRIAALRISKDIGDEELHIEMGRQVGLKYGKRNGKLNGVKNKGRIASKETRELLSILQTKENNGFWNHKHTEVTKKKIGRKNKQIWCNRVHPRTGTWEITFPEGKIKLVTNLNNFCKSFGLDQGHMSKVAQGKFKQHKGFVCTRKV